VQFVADESCAAPVISALRTAGHDVIAVAEISKGIPDEQVIERAFNERRVLITEDADFGELVYAHGQPSAGVIFVKFHRRARHAKPVAVVEAVAKLGERLRDSFTVVEAGRVRVGRRPRS
jgi:predicted nuclease of predicted toxin-antitoxin system